MTCNAFHRSLPRADVSLGFSHMVTRQAFPDAGMTLLARVAGVLQSYVGLKLTHTLLYQVGIPLSLFLLCSQSDETKSVKVVRATPNVTLLC